MSHLLLVQGNALAVPLAVQSVHCIVTSPPYYGLRDYGAGPWQIGLEATHDCQGWATGQDCGACYLCHLRAVGRELWRVLRDDGVLWLNIADSYNAAGRKGHGTRIGVKQGTNRASMAGQDVCRSTAPGLKEKDLCGIPQRLALALQADGWYWRSEIVWHKVNPMPESVTDRPTRSHEQVLLFSKQEHYFYDAMAIAEESAYPGDTRHLRTDTRKRVDLFCIDNGSRVRTGNPTASTRNARSVWTMASEPFSGAHFATMPTALVERCIKAGTPKDGTVFDPFVGSGTVLQVARALGRVGIGTDLSFPYLQSIARKRLGLAALAAWEGHRSPVVLTSTEGLPLFALREEPA